MYFRAAEAAIAVYDITNKVKSFLGRVPRGSFKIPTAAILVILFQSSFDNLEYWIIELEKNAGSDVVLALVGNKCDLEASRQVNQRGAYTNRLWLPTTISFINSVLCLFITSTCVYLFSYL